MSNDSIRTALATKKIPVNPISRMTLSYVEEKVLEAAKNGFYYVQICCDNNRQVENLATLLSSEKYRYYTEVRGNKYVIPVLYVDWSPEKEPSYESFDYFHPYR